MPKMNALEMEERFIVAAKIQDVISNSDSGVIDYIDMVTAEVVDLNFEEFDLVQPKFQIQESQEDGFLVPISETTGVLSWFTGPEFEIDLHELTPVDGYMRMGLVVTTRFPGDVRTGMVCGMEKFVDVECTDGTILTNVRSKDVWNPVFSYVTGSGKYWLGRECSEICMDEDFVATLLLEDGFSTLMVTGANFERHVDFVRPCSATYYPLKGMRITLLRKPKHGKWLKGKWKGSPKEQKVATVIRIRRKPAMVQWDSTEEPVGPYDARDLVGLSSFDSRYKGGDPIMVQTLPETTLKPRRRTCSLKGRRWKKWSRPKFKAPALVLRRRTLVDVLWNDGSKSLKLPSVILRMLAECPGEDEFFPGRYIFDDARELIGVTTSVDGDDEDDFAKVRWFDGPNLVAAEEVMNCLSIRQDPHYGSIFPGEFVRKKGMWPQGEDKSCVGQVIEIDLEDGPVLVRWANAEVSKIPPSLLVTTDMENIVVEAAPKGCLEQASLDWIQTMMDKEEDPQIPDFDIVLDYSDHKLKDETHNPIPTREWVKTVDQEWKIMREQLHELNGVYLRIYEDRMDLVRAVIKGAAGTPYHHALFVFDIGMPPDYPAVPPRVVYHSWGLRVNPNLYEDGRICLSLLNTWMGEGTERWTTGTSNIMQVLLSLQGLVLNAKPYFNEAGYDGLVGDEEHEQGSLIYNENAFVLSLRSMINMIKRPPLHVEELVRAHFVAQGQSYVRCCRAYMENEGHLQEGDPTLVNGSIGFKLSIGNFLPTLESRLSLLQQSSFAWSRRENSYTEMISE